MADLFNVIAGLQVTEDEILESATFWQSYLAKLHPDMDMRQGTAVQDLVIRPGATLTALVKKALEYNFDQNTIRRISNDSPMEMVDDILSNWFLNRNTGSNAVINARLFFAIRKVVNLPSSTSFSPDGKLKYFPTVSQVISAEQLMYDAHQNQFYFDVELISESADAAYNISTGSLLYFTNFDAYFLHGEIQYLVTEAVPPEKNSEYVARSRTAISTRNLVNKPSIDSRIREAFPTVKHTIAIGMGEPEMMRDLRTVQDSGGGLTQIHIGGLVDVYVDSPLAISSVQLTANSQGVVTVVGPVYAINRLSVSAGDQDDTIPVDAGYIKKPGYLQPFEDFGFSVQQVILLDFGPTYAGKTASFDLKYFQMVESVQAFADNADVRLLCGDVLIRGMDFYSLDIVVESHLGYVPDPAICLKAVEAYVATLDPSAPFVLSDLYGYFNAVNVKGFKTPVTVNYTAYFRDGTVETGSIVDLLDPPSRTAMFRVNSLTTQKVEAN